MTANEVALRHYEQRQRLAKAVQDEGRRRWRQVSPGDLRSWSTQVRDMMVVLMGAQLAAARQADGYITEALAEQGVDEAAEGAVVPQAFTGTASDGRSLEGLLWTPVVATKMAISQGQTVDRALATGRTTLDMVLRTQVADAGRVADGVAITARRRTGYVRMVVGRTCPRCTILAGRFYRYNAGFRRHPRCDCIHVPARGEAAARSEGLLSDPKESFDFLSKDEQDRVYTKAAAQAIRDGADMNQVVNARRGMSVAGVTTEGTSRLGLAGQRLQGGTRLMPESIYKLAGSRDEALSLLRRHGYLI